VVVFWGDERMTQKIFQERQIFKLNKWIDSILLLTQSRKDAKGAKKLLNPLRLCSFAPLR
jgi:hypothetical protein